MGRLGGTPWSEARGRSCHPGSHREGRPKALDSCREEGAGGRVPEVAPRWRGPATDMGRTTGTVKGQSGEPGLLAGPSRKGRGGIRGGEPIRSPAAKPKGQKTTPIGKSWGAGDGPKDWSQSGGSGIRKKALRESTGRGWGEPGAGGLGWAAGRRKRLEEKVGFGS